MARNHSVLLLIAWALIACGESARSGQIGAASGASGASGAPVMSAGQAGVEAAGAGGVNIQMGGHGGLDATAGAATMGGSGGDGASSSVGGSVAGGTSNPYPAATEIIDVLSLVNRQFASKWPDPAALLPGSRPSNIWTRAVYYEGLLGLHAVAPREEYLQHMLTWAEFHDWNLRASATNADNQCAGQIYFDLFELDGGTDQQRIAAIQQSLDTMVQMASNTSWTWIDAIQMSMPVFARFGTLPGNAVYLAKMHALYQHTKQVEGGGLYDDENHLWWRDKAWKPEEARTPSGKNVYWSRGNGWVVAALVRVLERLPEGTLHREEYLQDFVDLVGALRPLQRADGFWNASLVDAEHFGGPELTGTALFVYGMAWGIRRGVLDEAVFGPVVRKAWSGMLDLAVHPNGFLGFVQSTGEDPSDGQPLSYDKQPDFEDYGVGCFLLAGSELAKLAPASLHAAPE